MKIEYSMYGGDFVLIYFYNRQGNIVFIYSVSNGNLYCTLHYFDGNIIIKYLKSVGLEVKNIV